jgi:hypothetical protein
MSVQKESIRKAILHHLSAVQPQSSNPSSPNGVTLQAQPNNPSSPNRLTSNPLSNKLVVHEQKQSRSAITLDLVSYMNQYAIAGAVTSDK